MKRVGWFIPDTDLRDDHQHLVCLKIEMVPHDTASRKNLLKTWVIRGLVLKPVWVSARTSLARGSCFERVGYFEISCKHNGISNRHDYMYTKQVRHARGVSSVRVYDEYAVRNALTLDPNDFFSDECAPQEFALL